MHRAKILIRHTSSLFRGASLKRSKKYCDVYARKEINVETAGMASLEMENDEHSIFSSHR
jgi:hypothetical protein